MAKAPSSTIAGTGGRNNHSGGFFRVRSSDGVGYEPQSLAIAFSLRWLFLFLARKSAVFLAVDGKMRVPSRKEAFFMAVDGKMSLPSNKRGVFVDVVRDICYICMI